jgi:hypothetical protein
VRCVRRGGGAERAAGGPALRGEDPVAEAGGVAGPGCVVWVVGELGAAGDMLLALVGEESW